MTRVPAAAPRPLRAYACSVPVMGWLDEVVNACSRSAARHEYLTRVRESWPGLTYAHVRVRSLGAPLSSPRLRRVAAYRERPDLAEAGARVRLADGRTGAVVDADESCNFVVQLDGGGRVHVHHADLAGSAS